MSTGFINTGVTGLQVAQLALATTAHNITNADTAGYNRQRTVQTSNNAMFTGAGFVGQGASVTTIARLYDSFLSGQVNSAQTQVSALDSYHAQVSQIDNMLADANSGLSSALKSFFAGVQDVATNPSQISSRQAMISSAQSLTARFQALDGQLNQMYESVDGLITTTVASINSYTKQIGEVNQQIIIAQAANNHPANDLLDQRDQLVSDLNKLIKVSTTSNTDGSYNVFVGTGQQLVVGTQVTTMTAEPAADDLTRIVVGLKTSSGNQELPESLINGGSLGGLVSFRSESLDSTANQLGRAAASLALTFNAQNALGQDLLGNVAGDPGFISDFFIVPSPTVIPSTTNKITNPIVTVDYAAPAYDGNFYTDLTGSDYRLDYDGSELRLTRLSDNANWSAGTAKLLNDKLKDDPQGFLLDEAVSFNSSDAGATYLIEPTRTMAANISLNAAVAADPRLVNAAAPIRTAAAGTNTGSAAISAGSVGTGYQAVVAGVLPLALKYNSNTTPASIPAVANLTGFPVGSTVRVTNGTTVTDYPSLTATSYVPYVSGATVSLMTGPDPVEDSIALSVVFSGKPNNGDSFSIAKNSAGSSDGRNGLLLAKLQTQNTMVGQTATYQSAYAQLVSEVGNKTREVASTGAAQTALLEQTTASQQSLSGVNLDEEAANLVKYQQAYQASAKVIEMASKLFDALLAIN